MGDADDGSPRLRYCHGCGYEYQAAWTVCTDCGEPLVDEPLPEPEPAPPRVHGTAEVSLGGVGSDDRSLLEMLLRGQEIPASWRDDLVVVPADRVDAVEELMASLGGPGAHPAEPDEPLRIATVAGALRRGPAVAARWQRLVGWYVDAILLGVGGRLLADRDVSWWVITVLAALYVIVGVAVWGRTVGKLAVGTYVTTDDGRPSWTSSTLRWLLVGWVGFAVALESPVVGVLAFVTIVATYAPILWDPDGRGLHDRLAGTVVRRRGR